MSVRLALGCAPVRLAIAAEPARLCVVLGCLQTYPPVRVQAPVPICKSHRYLLLNSCVRKERYERLGHARAAAHGINKRSPRAEKSGPYRCPLCGGAHIGRAGTGKVLVDKIYADLAGAGVTTPALRLLGSVTRTRSDGKRSIWVGYRCRRWCDYSVVLRHDPLRDWPSRPRCPNCQRRGGAKRPRRAAVAA